MKKLESFFVRFSAKEQTLFAKRLSFLMASGVPILESLMLLRTQTKSKQKIIILDQVVNDVSNGMFLSTSLAKHGRLFSNFMINIIRVGESSGTLSTNLSYLAEELKKKQALKSKIMGALLYPIVITVGTVGVTTLLIMYVFPKILPIFISLHVTLPLSTRILVAVSRFLSIFGVWCCLLAIFGVGVFLFLRARREAVRLWGDRIVLSIPLARHIIQSYNLANFCRTLGLLLNSGTRLSEALVIAAEVTQNTIYKKVFVELSYTIQKGEPISRQLERRADLFPDMTRHLIAIGERTGSLPASLLYLCDLHEGELDEQAKQLSASIEPVLMVVMGLLVGFVAIAVITPMYEITSHLTPR